MSSIRAGGRHAHETGRTAVHQIYHHVRIIISATQTAPFHCLHINKLLPSKNVLRQIGKFSNGSGIRQQTF